MSLVPKLDHEVESKKRASVSTPRSALVKSVLALLFASVLLIGVTACGSSETSGDASTASSESTESGLSLEGKTIAYIQTGSLDYYEYSANAAEMAIEALGGSPLVLNSELDPQKEQANMQDAVTQGVDGIVMFPLSDASEKAAVRQANRADIPISIVGATALDELLPDIAGNAAVNFVDNGTALGKALAELVPTGDIAIITGASGRKEVVDFSEGLGKGLGDPSRIVAEVDGQYIRQEAFKGAQDLIAKYPDLAGLVVGNEDMAVGAIQGLGDKISDVKVASQNGSPEGIQLLKKGTLAVTVGASPGQEAVLAVRMLGDAVSGNPVPESERQCWVPFAIDKKGDIQSQPWEPTAALVDEWLDSKCADSSGS